MYGRLTFGVLNVNLLGTTLVHAVTQTVSTCRYVGHSTLGGDGHIGVAGPLARFPFLEREMSWNVR